MLFEVDKKLLNANNKPDRELKKQKTITKYGKPSPEKSLSCSKKMKSVDTNK
jgi:hypothetical protein